MTKIVLLDNLGTTEPLVCMCDPLKVVGVNVLSLNEPALFHFVSCPQKVLILIIKIKI